MTRYLPARHYRWFGMSAVALAGLCGWLGTELHAAYVPAALFLLTAGLLFSMAFRPAIEIHEGYVSIGGRIIPWLDIRRLDRAALIDGTPYRQYWGEVLAPGSERKPQSTLPRYRILRPEDEAEVERLYQR